MPKLKKMKKGGNITSDLKDSLEKFKKYLTGKGKANKMTILNKYLQHLAPHMSGSGKKLSGGKLISHIHQSGGSWGSFTDWFKSTAGKVGDAFKTAGRFVYDKAIKPGFNYVKSKPLSALGTVAGALSNIPGPQSVPLKALGIASGTVGSLTGNGDKHRQAGGAIMSPDGGRVLMIV